MLNTVMLFFSSVFLIHSILILYDKDPSIYFGDTILSILNSNYFMYFFFILYIIYIGINIVKSLTFLELLYWNFTIIIILFTIYYTKYVLKITLEELIYMMQLIRSDKDIQLQIIMLIYFLIIIRR